MIFIDQFVANKVSGTEQEDMIRSHSKNPVCFFGGSGLNINNYSNNLRAIKSVL